MRLFQVNAEGRGRIIDRNVFACARKVARYHGKLASQARSNFGDSTKVAIRPFVRKKHWLGEFAPLHRQLQSSRGKRKIHTVGRAQRHITQIQFHVLSNAHLREDSPRLLDRMLGPSAGTRIPARRTAIKVKVLAPPAARR